MSGALTIDETSDRHSSILQGLYRILQCQICTDLMTSPFILTCGHCYCYNCAYQWLRSHRSCPTCREKVRLRPTYVYGLKDACDLLIKNLGKTCLPALEATISRQLEKDDLFVQHAKAPFPGLFREHDASTSGGRIVDAEDHVMRCIRCHWEVEGAECSNCGYTFSEDDHMSEHDSNIEDELESESAEGELDGYDLEDSFIAPDESDISDLESSSDSSCSLSERLNEDAPTRRQNPSRIVISSDDDESNLGRSASNNQGAVEVFSDAETISSEDEANGNNRSRERNPTTFYHFEDEAEEESAEIHRPRQRRLNGRLARIIPEDD